MTNKWIALLPSTVNSTNQYLDLLPKSKGGPCLPYAEKIFYYIGKIQSYSYLRGLSNVIFKNSFFENFRLLLRLQPDT